MTDITITRNSELMVAQIEGESDSAVDFIDAWMPEDIEYTVVDSGRIIVSEPNLAVFVDDAERHGLTMETLPEWTGPE